MQQYRQRLWARFGNLRIQYKLLLGYSAILVTMALLGNGVVFMLVRNMVRSNIETQLASTTSTIGKLVQASAQLSVRNRLRAIAEKNKEISQHFFDEVKAGRLTTEEAKKQAKGVFLSQQSIGSYGYVYCLDTSGTVVFHPKPELEGTSLLGHEFIQEQVRRRQGYLEYTWKNPDEKEVRPKALYMTYFEPWGWIISASSYRDEFASLVDVNDFRDVILSLRFGDTGYPYVIDSRGNFIIHPHVGGNQYDTRDSEGRYFVHEICARRDGVIAYTWQNPGEQGYRKKLAYFSYLPEYDWIVVSSSYYEEFYAPLGALSSTFLVTTLVTLLLLIPVTLRLSSSITRPIEQLAERLRPGAELTKLARVPVVHSDEVGKLAGYFNVFLDRLDHENSERLRAEEERRKIEERLRHSEKLEAVGRLAGGVAHDFNNILAAIQGNAELMQLRGLATEQGSSAQQIVAACSRAARLTRSLLDFSRKKAQRSENVDIHRLIREVCELLVYSVDKRIVVETELSARNAIVRGNPDSLHNALLNLALNARDAMPKGGKLRFSTRNESPSVELAHPSAAPPVSTLSVVITDTGDGMPPSVMERVFEPFFTTKEPGKGTGLGLASVYGCIQSHGGDIEVRSQPGEGTSFHIRLPALALEECPPSSRVEIGRSQRPSAVGHILLVEDEPVLRDLLGHALQEFGHTVAVCADGVDALDYFAKHHQKVSLVVLDILMPGMDGCETFEQLRHIDPAVRVVLCSGHSQRGSAQEVLPEGAVGFLQKPYRLEDLGRMVAGILSGKPVGSSEQAPPPR